MKIEDTGAYQKMSFFGCKNLKTIVVEEGNREFDSRDNCNAIIITNRNFHENELLVLSSSTIVPASVEKISQSAIQCPKNLHTISVADGNPNFDSREGCNAIIKTDNNTLIIGSATTVIPESVPEIGDYAFWGNDELVEFTIPKTIAKIGKEAFRECQNLKTISILGPVALIDKDTFKDCASLETITFSTGIKKFHPEAFTNCTALKTINVPAKKGDYYRTRLPEALRDLVVELPAEKKAKR
jgi:hypothetical protein